MKAAAVGERRPQPHRVAPVSFTSPARTLCKHLLLLPCSSGALPIEDQLLSRINSALTVRGPLSSWGPPPILRRGSSSGSSVPMPPSMVDWEVQWEQVEMQRFLGRGSWGQVSGCVVLRSDCSKTMRSQTRRCATVAVAAQGCRF